MAPTRGRSSRRGSGAWATSSGRRCSSAVSRSPSSSGSGSPCPGSPGRSCSWSAAWSRRSCSTWASTASRSSARCRAASRCRRSRRSTWSLQHLPEIVISAVALLLIGFSQTAGDARAFATRHRYRIDVNQESVAQGMANLGAGVFQGMPVSTSLSASSLNESAGARTPVASLATGALVLATLILLAPLFSELPKAVLAAIIIDAVVFGMIDVAGAAAPPPGEAVRLLDRDGRAPRGAVGGRPPGCRDRDRAVARMAGLCRDEPVHAAPRSRGGDAGLPRPRRAPRGRDGTRVSRCCASTAACSSRRPRRVDDRVRAVTDGHPGLRTLVLDLEGVELRRLTGCREADRDPGAHRRGRTHAAPGPRQAARARRARGRRGSSTGSAPTTCTATSTGRSRPASPMPLCDRILTSRPGPPPSSGCAGGRQALCALRGAACLSGRGPSHCLDGRELVAELGADAIDLARREAQLLADLVDLRALG